MGRVCGVRVRFRAIRREQADPYSAVKINPQLL
jgi:hypothetical protein